MNDITALMATMKAAAERAGCEQWQTRKGLSSVEVIVKGSVANGRGCVSYQPVAADLADIKTAKTVALFSPYNVLALVEALEKAQRHNGYIREQSAEWERKAISNFEECAEMSARIEELESQRKLAFTAGNRWADKYREVEKRIAELESRTVTVKLPAEYLNADGSVNADMANTCPVVSAYREAHRAAGIQVIEGEG